MAKVTEVKLVDDLDGSEAVETVPFGLDGRSYEIDLSKEHAAALRENLQDFIGSARVVSPGSPRRRARGADRATSGLAAEKRAEDQAIREWARGAGFEVKDRGRIPKSVQEAYANRPA